MELNEIQEIASAALGLPAEIVDVVEDPDDIDEVTHKALRYTTPTGVLLLDLPLTKDRHLGWVLTNRVNYFEEGILRSVQKQYSFKRRQQIAAQKQKFMDVEDVCISES